MNLIVKNRHLIGQLAKREVLGRYKGSVLGLLWSFFTPLLLLAVYTFVFSVVFRARWPGFSQAEGHGEFAVILFTGLMVNNLFSECVVRAPTLVINHANFVKKVVFPLQILPLVVLCSALFHFAISLLVLLIAQGWIMGGLQATAVYLPVVLFPLLLTTVGVSWFLAALGVYIRDIAQATSLMVTVLTFMSPIFYPLSALPERLQGWVRLSPITFAVEETRNVVLFGQTPGLMAYGIHLLIGALIAVFGYLFFQKARKGFADVL